MRIQLQLVMCSDDGQEETLTDLVTLQKDAQRIEHLGLTLREAKQHLNTLQKRLLHHQVDTFLAGSSTCPDCGTLSKPKAIIPDRSVPYLRPSSSPVRDCSTAAARVARRPRSDHCPLSSKSRPPELLFEPKKHHFEVIVGKRTLTFT
jgi:hypothetical protein